MIKKLNFSILLLVGAIFVFSSSSIKQETTSGYKQKLSEYGFFTGNMADLQPEANVIPYDLNTPLFTDYALKARFIRLPEGQKAQYNAQQVLNFPIGTAIIKNFYYNHDDAKPEKGRQIIETRVLLLEEKGWTALPYIWNETQDEAILEVAGGTRTVKWKNAAGKKQKIDYQIPNMVMCKGCHSYEKKMIPIGPSARQLNKSFEYASGSKNQLEYWSEAGVLEGLPDIVTVPELSQWDDTDAALEDRARAYLDANCGHCHNPAGPANTSGMFLDVHTTDPGQLGVKKGPIAAGRGTGGLAHGIEPGKPDESILVFRMASTDPGIMMPEMGRQLTHDEGLALVKEWIRTLE